MIITPRQKELLNFLVQGKTAKEAAYQMGISHQTAKNHMTEMRQRLNAETTVHTVVKAIKQGIINL